MHGRILAELGDAERGVEEMHLGYDMWAETGAVVTQPFYLAMQSEGLALAERFDDALSVIDRALALVEEHGERYYEAEIRRLRGEFLLRATTRGADATVEAERCFLEAINQAQAQRLGSLELRGALSLAELPQSAGSPDTALSILTAAVRKVHGGETTTDRRRAEQVLQSLHLGVAVQSH
jgi:predicted ATPase